MSDRYERLFARLRDAKEGAFVPFAVAGDPDPSASAVVLEALVEGGADALEIGLPFSDPVADGPAIQRADARALAAGTGTAMAWDLIRKVRSNHPDLPIGLLVYANLVLAPGMDAFYAAAAEAGADSVLVVDAPTLEAVPFIESAARHGIAPVFIATPGMGGDHLRAVASLTRAYTYVVTRAGVTGADGDARTDHADLIARLRAAGAPPCLLGFGISRPEHVRGALQAGAAGAISGSAVAALIERYAADRAALRNELKKFVAGMKAATRG